MNSLLHILFAAHRRRPLWRALGRHRGLPESDRRRPRGDLDDHAELDRDLDRRVPLRPRRAAPERHPDLRPDLERHRRGRQASRVLGRRRPPGAPRRLLRRDRRARRLLADPQPDDARLRRQGGRLQPRGGALRRHQRLAQLLPRDGDLRRVRRPRGRSRRARLAVPARDRRHPGCDDRLRRHRGGAARPQHGRRGRARGAALRRPAHRDVDPQPRSRRSSSPSWRRT